LKQEIAMTPTSTLAPSLPLNLASQLQRAERRKKVFAISLTLPLLLFLLATFIIPIGALLTRAVENPEVASTLGRTAQALNSWDRTSAPPDAAYSALIEDLSAIKEQSDAGALARRLNSDISGARSLIMTTFRALPFEKNLTPLQTRERLLALDARWGELGYWQAIAKNGARWTPDYLLASLDLQRDVQGNISKVDADSAAFGKILVRTFQISAIVTLCCLILGYPLAYWLSTLSARQANMLMILVLVPFWTSILVRVAAWIVLLQTNGLVNRSLMGLGVTDEPIPLLFNRLGVIIAMVHILLPFMILPLYSVMKSVPATYLRAAVSLTIILAALPWFGGIAALRIARDVGGSDLGVVLRTLSALLRENARMRGEIEARQSWTVSAAKLAVAAPWVTLALLCTRPDAVRAYSSAGGAGVLLLAAALSFIAYRVMLRIGRLPAEPRMAA